MRNLIYFFALVSFSFSIYSSNNIHHDNYQHLIENKKLPIKDFKISGYLMPKDFSLKESKQFIIQSHIESCTHVDNDQKEKEKITIEVIFPKKMKTPLQLINVRGELQITQKKSQYTLLVKKWTLSHISETN